MAVAVKRVKISPNVNDYKIGPGFVGLIGFWDSLEFTNGESDS